MRVTRKKLAELELNESIIVTEAKNPKAGTGAQCQCYATRAGIKISTKKCFLTDANTGELISIAVIVTRLG
jgi:hypothetical protein